MSDSAEAPITVRFTVNGRAVRTTVTPRQHLADVLRGPLNLTGTHVACEHGVCGACNVILDGAVVRGCLLLAVQAEGRQVTTIEGLDEQGTIADLQAAFVERNALQCGFCTPGMLLTAQEFLSVSSDHSRAAIREAISGNLCRCTGYHAIVDAIAAVAADREGRNGADVA